MDLSVWRMRLLNFAVGIAGAPIQLAEPVGQDVYYGLKT